MTRSDQRIMARAHVLIPDEDVTELAPDDFALIRSLEAALKYSSKVIAVLVALIIAMGIWIVRHWW